MLKNDAESNAATEAFVAADIDQILAAGERVTIGGGASKAGGAFSKATFTAEEAEEGEGEGGGDDAAGTRAPASCMLLRGGGHRGRRRCRESGRHRGTGCE